MMNSPQAAKWQWFFMNFGGNFKRGLFFEGSYKIPLIGKWFVFPSIAIFLDKLDAMDSEKPARRTEYSPQ